MVKASLALLLAVVISGCATLHGKSWDGAQADADRDHCRAESKGKEPGVAEKAAVYASNILIVPVSMALTLGLFTMYVYPKSGYAAEQGYYDQCMRRLGYDVK